MSDQKEAELFLYRVYYLLYNVLSTLFMKIVFSTGNAHFVLFLSILALPLQHILWNSAHVSHRIVLHLFYALETTSFQIVPYFWKRIKV